MWNVNAFTRCLGIEYPIVQGPFGGGGSSVKLVSTVSNAGGLGSYGMQSLDTDQIIATAADIRACTDKPFALNLWMPKAGEKTGTPGLEYLISRRLLEPYFQELGVEVPELPARFTPDPDSQIEAILQVRPPVFSFVYGIPPDSVLSECRANGIKTMGTATTAAEALVLEDKGVDCIVASGAEAGGHKASFLDSVEDSLTGTFALVPQIVGSVHRPVVAAGGIVDARGVAAALALGASGVQIGTAFLACEESGASALHRETLFSSDAWHTTLSRGYTGRVARGIKNRVIDEITGAGAEPGSYPMHAWLMGNLSRAAAAQWRPDLASFSAGQAAPLIHHRRAEELFIDLVHETPHVLSRLLGNPGLAQRNG